MNVDVTGSVATIETAFHVTMGVYQHPTENRTFYAPDREPTPDLPFQLWHISGLDNYSIPHPCSRATMRKSGIVSSPNATTGSGPSSIFSAAATCGRPTTVEQLSPAPASRSGCWSMYGTDLADLNTYFTNAGQTNNVPINSHFHGRNQHELPLFQGCDDTEQTLDMTQALGMAPGLSSLVMYVGSTDAAIFNAMATASPLNAQLSSSWTWSPADPSTDNPYFEEFAAQGQNLFQAAGDSGAWTSSSEIYPADDAYRHVGRRHGLSRPAAPAGPWSSETAWVDGGGGISPDKFAIPSWQTAAASRLLQLFQQLFATARTSRQTRILPFTSVPTKPPALPTSMAGPVLRRPCGPATWLWSINRRLPTASRRSASSIRPFMTIGLGSSYDTDFHDITSGSNGYSATTGYDLATGWGSPNGSRPDQRACSAQFTLLASPFLPRPLRSRWCRAALEPRRSPARSRTALTRPLPCLRLASPPA